MAYRVGSTHRVGSNGQVTLPENVRQALRLETGSEVEFAMNAAGEIVMRKARRTAPRSRNPNRFAEARGTAPIKWNADELMKLLRGDD